MGNEDFSTSVPRFAVSVENLQLRGGKVGTSQFADKLIAETHSPQS